MSGCMCECMCVYVSIAHKSKTLKFQNYTHVPPSKQKSHRRNNVSCAIIKRRASTPPGQTPRCVLIDCGKTFREVILNLFPKHGLREVGALLLTHGHADAILGMDGKSTRDTTVGLEVYI